jgi:hypothetical protein
LAQQGFKPLNGKALTLGQDIASQFKSQIEYRGLIAPIGTQLTPWLENPNQIGDLAAPTPLQYAVAIMWHTLQEYLEQLNTLEDGDPALATELADVAMRFAEEDTSTHLTTILVDGLYVEGGPIQFGPITLRELTPIEAGHANSIWPQAPVGLVPGHRLAPFPQVGSSARYAIEVRTEASKLIYLAPFQLTALKVICALHLLGFPTTGRPTLHTWMEPTWLHSGHTGSPLPFLSEYGSGATAIATADLRRVMRLVDQIRDSAVTNPPNTHDVALHRFATAVGRTPGPDSFLDYAIALEAMFLSGSGRGESGLRFALAGALHLGKRARPDLKREYFNEFRAIYDMRSRIFHGESVDASELAKLVTITKERARLSLLKALRSEWPVPGQLVDELFRS